MASPFRTSPAFFYVPFTTANQYVFHVDFEHAARPASNAPVLRRPPPEDLMERVRASVVPERFEFVFHPEELDIRNRMETYTVPVHVPNWLSRVR